MHIYSRTEWQQDGLCGWAVRCLTDRALVCVRVVCSLCGGRSSSPVVSCEFSGAGVVPMCVAGAAGRRSRRKGASCGCLSERG